MAKELYVSSHDYIKISESLSEISSIESTLISTKSKAAKKYLSLISDKDFLSSPYKKTKMLLENYMFIDIYGERLLDNIVKFYELEYDSDIFLGMDFYEQIKLCISLDYDERNDFDTILRRVGKNTEYLRLVKFAVEEIRNIFKNETMYKVINLRYIDRDFYLKIKKEKRDSGNKGYKSITDEDVMNELNICKKTYYKYMKKSIKFISLILFGTEDVVNSVDNKLLNIAQ